MICYNCGEKGHIARLCTAPASANASRAPAAAAQPLSDPDTTAKEVLEAPAYPREIRLESGARISEVVGDLMTSSDNLCHCVSACLGMGKGIAVHFKERFGGVEELKRQQVGVGGVATLVHRDTAAGDGSGRVIYYLVTKPRYFHKPTYQTLASSLAAMFQHMADHGISTVSMPEIGCGLDMLEWPRVLEMLKTMLRGSTFHVTVYHFRPPRP